MKQAKIKKGARVFHDFKTWTWPNCANEEPADVETVFNVTYENGYYDLSAPGFGSEDNFRNGSVYVTHLSDLEFVK